nr:LysM peptidoglycan-binding domain-containing protein [Listeria ilorinensis]
MGLFTGEDQTATSEKVPIEQTKKKEKPATDDASKEGASEKAQQEQPAAATAQTYEVQAGDSLSGIAAKFYPNASVQTSVEKIKKANNLETDTINPGQILKIPA